MAGLIIQALSIVVPIIVKLVESRGDTRSAMPMDEQELRGLLIQALQEEQDSAHA